MSTSLFESGVEEEFVKDPGQPPSAEPEPQSEGQAEVQEDPEESTFRLNLWQRIQRVMRDVQPLKKDSQAGSQIGGFSYPSADQVFQVVRGLISKYGISIVPTVIDHEVVVIQKGGGGERTEVVVKLSIDLVNCDLPKQRETIIWMGDGQNFAGAYSSALKLAVTKTFLLSAEEGDAPAPRQKGNRSSNNRSSSSRSGPPPDRSGGSKADLKKLHDVLEDLGLTEGQANVRAIKMFSRDTSQLNQAEVDRLAAAIKADPS